MNKKNWFQKALCNMLQSPVGRSRKKLIKTKSYLCSEVATHPSWGLYLTKTMELSSLKDKFPIEQK